MYQEGLKGNKKFSPDHCRELAQQFINYAAKHRRHFKMHGIKTFLKEMNEIIKKRQTNLEELIEHRPNLPK